VLGNEPANKMTEQDYFQYQAIKGLEGGTYGESPFKMFGKGKAKCSSAEGIHVYRVEFKHLATE
jgi:hypothetical protein